MGLPALVALIWLWAIHRNDKPVDDRFSPSSPQTRPRLAAGRGAVRRRRLGDDPSPAQPAAVLADPIAQLERLQKLREAGASDRGRVPGPEAAHPWSCVNSKEIPEASHRRRSNAQGIACVHRL